MHWFFPTLFWTSAGCIGFSYLGYPLLIRCASALRWHPASTEQSLNTHGDVDPPSVTVLIAAHNAGPHIQERIRNILESDVPPESLSVVVASDGSTDDTLRVVRDYGDSRVRAIEFASRRGKAQTLADAIAQLDDEIVVFTDATTRFETQSLRRLTGHFKDPEIGIASGRIAIVDEQGQACESLYWRNEMAMRRCEARLGILLGSSGAIYAIRRRLFVAPSRPIINDDLVFPMLIQLRHRCRFVLDPTAVAYAISHGGLASEFRRRCRIGAGAYQCLPVLSDLFCWKNRRQAFAFTSRKLLRWLCPFFLILLICSSLALLDTTLYACLFWAQAGAYTLASLGIFAPRQGFFSKVAGVASSFLVMNLALLAGFVQWLLDSDNVLWTPTPRPSLGSATPNQRN